MEIYNFLNSIDIAEYCRSIQYQFNAMEAAFIVFNSDTLTIEKRHAAYTEIIDTMPDMNFCGRKKESLSLHQVLKDYMKIEDRLQELFYAETEKTVYQYSCLVSYDRCDEWFEEKTLYDTCSAVLTAIQSENSSRDPEDKVKRYGITKKRLNSGQFIRAMATPDGRILEYYSQGALCTEEQRLHNWLFRDMWIKIPTPFRKGDIVAGTADSKAWSSEYNQQPFVLEEICYWSKNAKGNELHGHDAFDMTAYGYWVDNNGRLFYECMHSYQNLEYYKGALTGNQRILTAVSNHMKGEIDYALLLNAYEILHQEKQLEDNRQIQCRYTDEGQILAGLSEKMKKENVSRH